MKITPFILLLITAMGCQQASKVEVNGFDAYTWKRDKFGCSSIRLQMADTLLAQRDKLITLNENELIGVLGKPDARDLYVRNQKFLIYLLEPNQRCNAPEDVPVQARALHIRLNALGNANEMYISPF
ncbi:hypothetical protein D770_03270 [Flammeovirgaceae bacterium 311]|nr:hypothetical protein D770_03270 [Flammeovirgaceae bacterium 311]